MGTAIILTTSVPPSFVPSFSSMAIAVKRTRFCGPYLVAVSSLQLHIQLPQPPLCVGSGQNTEVTEICVKMITDISGWGSVHQFPPRLVS